MIKILATSCMAIVAMATVTVGGLSDVLAQKKRDVNYEHIINLAGIQRMITQQLSKEVILVAMGYEKEENIKQLKASHALFDRTLRGLRDGDVELRLTGTKNKRILEELDRVEELWTLFDSALQETLSRGSVSRASVAIVSGLSIPLLNAMNATVEQYKNEAAEGNLHSLLSVSIDISSRQQMLSQKMAKEILLIAYGQDVAKNREFLGESMKLFETSLENLIEGNFEIQLLPAPTQAIRAQLRRVRTVWNRFRPLAETAAKTGRMTPQNLKEVVSMNVTLLKTLNKAVNMYEAL